MIIKKDLTSECRPGNTKQFCIVHHTASSTQTTMQGIVNFFKKPDYVSVHYVVGRTEADGITQMVDENNVAFHAGVSEWGGVKDLNNHSIGIEVLSDGQTFTDWQIQATTELIRYIMVRNGIPASKVLRHADVAMPRGRKSDVGPAFFKQWGTWEKYQEALAISDPQLERNYSAAADCANIALAKLNTAKKALADWKGVPFVELKII